MATNDQKPKTPTAPATPSQPARTIDEGLGVGKAKVPKNDGNRVFGWTVTNTMPAPPNKGGSGNKGK